MKSEHSPSTSPCPATHGAGVNDGSVKDLAALYQNAKKPLLVAFLNTAAPKAAEWLTLLPSLAGAACNVFVVAFKHKGIGFQPCAETDASGLARSVAAAAGDALFQAIPIVIDGDGAVSKLYLFRPLQRARRQGHLVVPAGPGLSHRGQWHTSAKVPSYPISFKHITLSPGHRALRRVEPGEHAGLRQAADRQPERAARHSLLEAPGRSVIHIALDIRKVFFSRPLLERA